MSIDNDRKRANQAEYRAKLLEAELNAVRSSQAYQLTKKLGIIKSQVTSDPIGLTKKVAKMLVKNPKKVRHLVRSANRGAFIRQSVSEQTAKYQEWILLNEPDESGLEEQRGLADALAYKPLISIITPVFNPPIPVFEELIESVLEQTYTNFELCLGNFGDDPEVEATIVRYSKLDARVKHYPSTNNEGIAGNSNQILEQAKGEFLALLDHDDTLSPDALYENAKMLNDKPYDFIYSDKDKIDEQGNRFDPLFKPAYSPEMMLNINYLTHLNVMRTSIVREIGGWDSETDGAQDWDIFLRVISNAKHVGFIPKILYHWRVIATSTAMSIETKPYALANQCKAVDKYLQLNNIPAHARIERTELFLEWDKAALDEAPLVFIYHSNLTNTLRCIRRLKKLVPGAVPIILQRTANGSDQHTIQSRVDAEVLVYESSDGADAVMTYIATTKNKTAKHVLFLLDSIRLPKNDAWYQHLTGWLGITDVLAVSGRLVDRRDIIVSAGGLIRSDFHYFPLFHGFPRYYQSYIGNAEWVRDLSVITPLFAATKVQELRAYAKGLARNAVITFDDYFLELSSHKGRIVFSPHATASVFEAGDIDPIRPLSKKVTVGDAAVFHDPYNNPNMAPLDPMRLFDQENLVGVRDDQAVTIPIDLYQHDATILAGSFDLTAEELAANQAIVSAPYPKGSQPQSVAWFLPSFDGVYAGLVNIFSFAEYLATTEHLRTTIYVLKGGKDAAVEQELVVSMFPGLAQASFVAIVPDAARKTQHHDIGIATQWATTYLLAKANNIARKCYFIQDNEANFYPKGSISALVELGYSFGFTAIAGTKGLLDMYQKTYGGSGVVLNSNVDLTAYHPRKDRYYTPEKPYKVFFYARPNMSRNAFELGIAGLKKLKQDMQDEVEIITAGAPWDVAAYGVEGLFTNLGKIDIRAVPKLYRTIDTGLMFMFSGHPGVTASELMASGCPVVVNAYDDITWNELYEDGTTCLVTLPTASEVARNLRRCLIDNELRKQLIDGGLAKTAHFYEGYTTSQAAAYAAIINKTK